MRYESVVFGRFFRQVSFTPGDSDQGGDFVLVSAYDGNFRRSEPDLRSLPNSERLDIASTGGDRRQEQALS
jgi:hypothetical protein